MGRPEQSGIDLELKKYLPKYRATYFLALISSIELLFAGIAYVLGIISGGFQLANSHPIVEALNLMHTFTIVFLFPILLFGLGLAVAWLVRRRFLDLIYVVLATMGFWYGGSIVMSYWDTWRANPVGQTESQNRMLTRMQEIQLNQSISGGYWHLCACPETGYTQVKPAEVDS